MPASNLIFVLLNASLFVEALLYGLIVPVVPYYAGVLHADSGQLGLIFAMYSLALLLGSFPAGIACDRFGRRPVLLAGLVVLMVSTLLFAWVNNIWLLVLSRIIQGAAGAAIWTAGLAAASAMFPREERGRRLGLMMAVTGLGTIAGPVFSGIVFSAWGYRATFYVTALAILPVFLAFLRLPLPEPERTAEGEEPGFKELFKSLGDSEIAMVMLLIIAGSYGFGMLEPLMPLRLFREFNLDSRAIGFFFGVLSLSYTIAQPLWGYASDRIGYRPVIIAGLAVTLLVTPALALAPGIFYVYAAGSLFGIANCAMMTPCLPMLAEHSENSGKESYGRSFGLVNAAYSTGLLLGPALGGMVAREFSFLGAAAVYSLILLLIGAGVVRRFRKGALAK